MPERGLSVRVREEIARILRTGQVGALLGSANVGPTAQIRGVGFGIENVRRGRVAIEHGNAATYSSLSATNWTELDAVNLKRTVAVSGRRPVSLMLSAVASAETSQTIRLSLTWDGVEVTGVANGMCFLATGTATQITGIAEVRDPSPGVHTLAVVYRVSGGTTSRVFADVNNRLHVRAVED